MDNATYRNVYNPHSNTALIVRTTKKFPLMNIKIGQPRPTDFHPIMTSYWFPWENLWSSTIIQINLKRMKKLQFWTGEPFAKKNITFKLSCNPQSSVLPSGLNVKQRTPLVWNRHKNKRFLKEIIRQSSNKNFTLRYIYSKARTRKWHLERYLRSSWTNQLKGFQVPKFNCFICWTWSKKKIQIKLNNEQI